MKLPQLSLRELFWLLLAVGLSLGWWLEWRTSTRLRSDLDHYKEAWRIVNWPGNHRITDPLKVPLP